MMGFGLDGLGDGLGAHLDLGALAIKLDSRGPVFVQHDEAGEHCAFTQVHLGQQLMREVHDTHTRAATRAA